MLLRRLFPRLALLACSLLLACAPPGEGLFQRVGAALRARFPAQAARVLAAPGAFTAAAAGFSAEPRDGVGAELPRRGEGALRFALGPGFAVRVREVGALGEGAREGRAVRYARAGGASFWAAEEDGYEEWLLLEAGAVHRDAPVAAWEIEGAAVRQQGDSIALVDASGEARLMVTAPEAYAAGGRPVAAQLTARGERIELRVDAEGEAVLVDPAWRRTRAMTQGRAGHTATLLRDGRVLVVGGAAGVLARSKCPAAKDPVTGAATGCALRSAEIYDPKAREWTPAAPMTLPRLGHTATLLPDGSVLVAGGMLYAEGVAAPLVLSYTERYFPATDTWAFATAMSSARAYHTATQLTDGRVLVAGGMGSAYVAGAVAVKSAEVYDPVSNTWAGAGVMHTGRSTGHTATLLADGSVLVAGGAPGYHTVTNAVELYDPQVDPTLASPWRTIPSLVVDRVAHAATLLGDTILFTGGDPTAVTVTAELYSVPAKHHAGGSTLTGPMQAARHAHTATLVDGQVIIAGGAASAAPSAEGYTSASGFVALPPMNASRLGHTATLLADGSVLVAGGIGEPNLSSAELYDGQAHLWTPAAPMAATRAHFTATLLADGSVLAAGGIGEQSSKAPYLATTEVYDPHAGAWTSAGTMTIARSGHTATLLRNHQVLVAGGASGYDQMTSAAEFYTPGASPGVTWAPTGSMIAERYDHLATLLGDGRVLVTGGFDGGGLILASAEIYEPGDGTWSSTDAMITPRYAHTATLLADGRVLVTGGRVDSGDGDLASALAELWDPGTGHWTPAHSMITARGDHAAILLDGGLVLVTGGNDVARRVLESAELYDPVHDAWTTAAQMNGKHTLHTLSALGGGNVLVAGGDSASAETYEPAAPSGPTWTLVASTAVAHEYAGIAPLGGGRVLVTGGIVPSTTPGLSTTEIFEPEPHGAVCAGAFECASGACLGGVCCDSACDVGCTACSIADGAITDGQCTTLVSCGGFACQTQSPPFACFTACTTSEECARGLVCDPGVGCLLPLNSYVDTCAVSPRPVAPLPRRPIEPAVLLLATLAAVRRRAGRRGV